MTKKSLMIVLRVLVGVAIVAVVLANVDWSDKWISEGAEAQSGRILSQSMPSEGGFVRFRTEDGREVEVPVTAVREGLFRLVRNLRWSLFFFAAIPLLVTYLVNAIRWMVLSRALDLTLSLGVAFRLSFIGLFFNNVVPGATGGDVVRAYYVARTGTRRMRSVVAVVMDRIVGLAAMAFQAGVVAIFFWSETRLRGLTTGIFCLVGVICFGTAIFYSKRARKLLRVDKVSQILPLKKLFHEADEALFAYRYKKKAILVSFLLSFVSQGFFIFSQFVVGTALGVECGIGAYLLVIPLASIVSSIPVLPGGWGVGDAAYVYFFGLTGVTRAPALAIGVLYRLLSMGWSLLGGLFLVSGGKPASQISVEAKEVEEAEFVPGEDPRP